MDELKSMDLTPEVAAAVMRQAQKPQSTIATKARRGLGSLGNYYRSLKKKLTKTEVDVEMKARQRAAEIDRQYGKVGRQRARHAAREKEFSAVSSGPGKLDLPRKARRKIARARAKKGARG